MTRTLLLATAVLGVAVGLALGSYAALAGSGPVSDAAGALIGAGVSEGDDDEAVADDAQEGDDDADVNADGETGQGAEHVAQVIADAFGTTQEEVLAMHDEGIGFGALFKLYALADATNTPVDDLLATMQNADGEFEFAFGKQFKALTDEQLAAFDSGPNNLGELVSRSNHTDGASLGLEEAKEKVAAAGANGHGPPDGVPAHGRN